MTPKDHVHARTPPRTALMAGALGWATALGWLSTRNDDLRPLLFHMAMWVPLLLLLAPLARRGTGAAPARPGASWAWASPCSASRTWRGTFGRRAPCRAPVDRPRPLQAGERPLRPPGRRHRAGGRGEPHPQLHPRPRRGDPPASVGVALVGFDVTDTEELLHRADVAMYQAKRTAPAASSWR